MVKGMDQGRSHSGGVANGGQYHHQQPVKQGGSGGNSAMLPNISQGQYNHNGQRTSNSYPTLANGSKVGLGGESSSRSPSAGVSGRVDWKSKYLK
jgi:hypothetical protein